MYARATIETSVGHVGISLTSAGHMHVSDDLHVMWRGAPYTVSLHLYRDEQGTWAPKPSDTWNDRHHAAYITRQSGSKRFEQVHEFDTPTIYRGIVGALVEAVNAYMPTRPDMSKAAEIEAAQRDIDTAERKVSEARAALDAAQAELVTAIDRMAQAEVL